MMKIEMVSSRPDRAGRYLVSLDTGGQLRLYRQTIEDFGLYAGLEISSQQFKKIVDAAGQMSAKMRAIRIVSASNVSKTDLQQRLIRKGENPKQAQSAVAWMEELDLLDDRKTAEHIVRQCASKGYGILRAKQALYEKKIPKDIWGEVLDDYPDQEEFIRFFLLSRIDGNSDQKQIKKAIDALIRRGHNYNEIRNVMRNISLETEVFPEE